MSQSLGLGGERRYSVPSNPLLHDPRHMHSEDLHAWSIYRQNLNSDFTDSALGSTDKSPLPYGNFQLRDTTVQSILSHPRYGPKYIQRLATGIPDHDRTVTYPLFVSIARPRCSPYSGYLETHAMNRENARRSASRAISALGSNMYTYLKFGLPRVFPPNHNGSQRSGTPKPKTSIGSGMKPTPRIHRQSRGVRETSSGYDSSDNETSTNYKYSRKYRSDPDFRMQNIHPSLQPHGQGVPLVAMQQAGLREPRWTSSRHKSVSEANLLGIDARPQRSVYSQRRNSVADYVPDNDHQSYLMPSSHLGGRMSKAGSHMSIAQSRKHSTLRPGDHLDGYAHSAYIYPNYYQDLHGTIGLTSSDVFGFLRMDWLGATWGSWPVCLACGPHRRLNLFIWESYVQQWTSYGGYDDGFDLIPFQSRWAKYCPSSGKNATEINLEITSPENKSALLVSGLSFEVKSGEILAVLATAQQEATGLLDVLAGVRKKLSGDIVLNGQPVASSTLRKVAAYVRKDTSLCPSMTVEHTLRFHAALRRPRQNQHQVKMDDRDRINLLIEELGLEQVRDTNVARLTRSEIRRLNVACQLLLDTAVLILDQPTKEMDIFDTFFLVEYLRNWASTGRVVIMSLHPPTYEIFAMLTKVVLISAGRTMFSGYRRDMLPYFASIDYPCPAFKNPSDYYLDLVTLDDLSAAAMLESSGRIEALASVFAGAQSPPEPPPPVPLPVPIARPNVFVQAFALVEKSLVFTQMTMLSNVVTRVLIAAIMSLITGTIFWDLPTTDAKLTQNDRIGFHYSVMCLAMCPLLLWLSVREASSMRRHVERDVAVPLYSRAVFMLYDQFLELWSAVLTWLAYLVPSYAMSGLYAQTPGSFDGFYIYLGYTALYLIAIQMLFRAVVFLVPMEKTAAIIGGFCLLLSTLVNGAMLHQQDLPQYWRWLEYVSPSRWTLPEILQKEMSETALKTSISKEMRCTNKQRYQDIIVQSPCPPPNGTQVLSNFEYLRGDKTWEWTEESFLVALAIFYAVFAFIAILAFGIGFWRPFKTGALDGRPTAPYPKAATGQTYRSALGSNMYTYLKFGLPRVFPPNHNGSQRSGTPKPKTSIGSGMKPAPRIHRQSRGVRETSSGYDSSDNETSTNYKYSRKYRSDPDFRMQNIHPSLQPHGQGVPLVAMQQAGLREPRWTSSRHKSVSEANLLGIDARPQRSVYSQRRNSVADYVPDNDHQSYLMPSSHLGGRMSKAGSHMSIAQSRKHSTLRPGDHLDGYAHSAYIYPNYYQDLHGTIGLTSSDVFGFLRMDWLGATWGSPPPTDCKNKHKSHKPKYHHHHTTLMRFELDFILRVTQPFTMLPDVNSLEITSPENKSALLVSGLSFEVKSGEILAVLATAQQEATGLLDVLAGVRKKLSGDIVLNGQPVASSTLRKVAAYVRKDTSLCPSMTVEHTLRFHAALRRPRQNQHQVKMDDRDRINLLIEELGLEQVRDTNVARLTRSEIRRLNVACQLLLDTAVLILDQPTKEMDIFDTFFLVEYLRNWASTGRVVIMSLHPPTYEIFAMLTKVVLISAGRTMFSGYRRDMLPYFASIDYPCPAFKNPSDYYLDLVTLDDLSAAAMLESSGRIEALASVFAGAQSPPEPPPPVPLPVPIARPNVFVQAFALVEKSLVFTQMTMLSNVVTRVLIAAIMSLITGTIFWDLPTTDAKLTQNDRIGFHYSVMCLAMCPLLLWLSVREASSMRRHVERDVAVPLYSRAVFMLYDQFLELWSAVLTWLAYLVPSYAMSGLYAQTPGSFDGFYIYLGYTALYLIAIQMLFRAVVFLVPMEKTAAIIGGFCLLLSTLVNGAMLHQQDLPQYWRWLEYVSPSRWTLPEILQKEMSETALKTSISKEMRCTNKQRYQDIIVQSPCPPPNGTQVLSNFEYLRGDKTWEWTEESFLVALAIFYAVFAFIAILAFVCDCTKYVRRKERHSMKGHKVTVNTP
ncbi:hypothetical protein MSG28_007735 [Choristoneura fumiferana]|uniref:Uncharacterized protein n=1 Tax=Choristoneura fumiferana TaxID=7141 RepID=A0ACC0JYE6_CHOFU|nr:hypothetical protein MSG28_007735 [Choristoneura fumiferana]